VAGREMSTVTAHLTNKAYGRRVSIVVQPDPRPPAVRESERYGQRRGPGCLTRGAGRPGTIWIDNGSNRDVL
jgi:hypothetical protein